MKTVIYHVSTDDEKWKNVVVEDFRYIATSGLFKKCDKLRITINDRKTNDILSGEEWVRFFWGRVDDTNKVEIHVINEPPDIEKWIYPDEDILYINTNDNK